MPKFRQGSRKAKVYEHFRQHGFDETLKFGEGLGLAKGTLKSWMGSWKNIAAAPTLEPRKGKRRVALTYWLGRKGQVIKEGPEVSEVEWDSGSTKFVPNGQLVDIED